MTSASITGGATAGSNAGMREYVQFRVGGQSYCIDIQANQEIRGWSTATPLPHAPEYMKGVVNLRGVVLPILDLAARLGLPADDPSARHAIIVVECGRRTVGLLVEGVSDIIHLEDALRQDAPELAGPDLGVIAGVFAVDGDLISLLSIESIIPEQAAAA